MTNFEGEKLLKSFKLAVGPAVGTTVYTCPVGRYSKVELQRVVLPVGGTLTIGSAVAQNPGASVYHFSPFAAATQNGGGSSMPVPPKEIYIDQNETIVTGNNTEIYAMVFEYERRNA